jgi:hypothetical protein
VKITGVTMTAPIVLALWIDGRRKDAAWLATATAVCFALAVVLLQSASGGRFLSTFAPAITGGMTAADASLAVPHFQFEAINKPFDVAVPFVVACWCAIKRAWRRRSSWVDLYLLTSTIVTCAIFGSPGTVSNHLVEVQLVTTLVIGVALARREVSIRAATWAYAALAVVLAAVSWPLPGIPSVPRTLAFDGPRPRALVQALHQEFLPPNTRYISVDPVIPVLNGERPFLLDAFNMERYVIADTPAARDLKQRIESRFFDVIILRDGNHKFPHDMNSTDPDFAGYEQSYWAREDAPVTRVFRTAYELTAVREPFVIMMRK